MELKYGTYISVNGHMVLKEEYKPVPALVYYAERAGNKTMAHKLQKMYERLKA